MTKEDILRWALQAWDNTDASFFESFAALVAAHERERVARWMIENGYATGHGDDLDDLLRHLVSEEREACAQVCEGFDKYAANAIRARGEK